MSIIRARVRSKEIIEDILIPVFLPIAVNTYMLHWMLNRPLNKQPSTSSVGPTKDMTASANIDNKLYTSYNKFDRFDNNLESCIALAKETHTLLDVLKEEMRLSRQATRGLGEDIRDLCRAFHEQNEDVRKAVGGIRENARAKMADETDELE
ncbi:MAG: hypothetical protein Q9168_006353 [Polycauliona sp. 1 TL-2023]